MRVPLEHGQGPAGDVVIFVYGAEVVSGYVEGTETLWHTTTTANKDQDQFSWCNGKTPRKLVSP